MKLICLVFTLLFSGAIFLAQVVVANECEENEDYSILLCGDWAQPEIDEIMTFLVGDEEIHKIIKKNENYYLLQTCKERTETSDCIRGFVNVIERSNGILTIRPEGWDWFLP